MGFFESIIYYFKTIFNFIGDIFSDLIFIIESIGKAASSIPDWLGWLPVQVVTLFTGGLSLIIIYKILGRD